MPRSLYAQTREERLEIYFRQDIDKVETNVGDNNNTLEKLAELLNNVMADKSAELTKIEIECWTSPEPGAAYNNKLSWRRSNSLREYILERWDIPDSLLVARGKGIAWDKLRKMVAESEMQYRDKVLDILDNVPEETWGKINPNDKWLSLIDSRLKHLMDLCGGRAYKLLYDDFFPELRYGSQLSLFYA